jgi:hypothetical protein
LITRNDCIDAITKCIAYDPMHSPRSDALIAEAWTEHFNLYPFLSSEDLLAAVREYYKTPQRPWPQPADLSSIARAKLRDIADRAPELERASASEELREKRLAEIRAVVKRWR